MSERPLIWRHSLMSLRNLCLNRTIEILLGNKHDLSLTESEALSSHLEANLIPGAFQAMERIGRFNFFSASQMLKLFTSIPLTFLYQVNLGMMIRSEDVFWHPAAGEWTPLSASEGYLDEKESVNLSTLLERLNKNNVECLSFALMSNAISRILHAQLLTFTNLTTLSVRGAASDSFMSDISKLLLKLERLDVCESPNLTEMGIFNFFRKRKLRTMPAVLNSQILGTPFLAENCKSLNTFCCTTPSTGVAGIEWACSALGAYFCCVGAEVRLKVFHANSISSNVMWQGLGPISDVLLASLTQLIDDAREVERVTSAIRRIIFNYGGIIQYDSFENAAQNELTLHFHPSASKRLQARFVISALGLKSVFVYGTISALHLRYVAQNMGQLETLHAPLQGTFFGNRFYLEHLRQLSCKLNSEETLVEILRKCHSLQKGNFEVVALESAHALTHQTLIHAMTQNEAFWTLLEEMYMRPTHLTQESVKSILDASPRLQRLGDLAQWQVPASAAFELQNEYEQRCLIVFNNFPQRI